VNKYQPQFKSVMLQTLGSLGVLMTQEIDCVVKPFEDIMQPQQPYCSMPDSWAEIKTSRFVPHTAHVGIHQGHLHEHCVTSLRRAL